MSSEPPAHVPLRPRSSFNNWITVIGAIVAIGALFSFALLVWMDFTQGDQNPYLGIFTYMVAPGFLMTGIALIFIGAWMQRRYELKHAGPAGHRWQLDFADRRQRRYLILMGTGALGFLVLSAFGSYQTYHYSESNQFCGETCHKAMAPEYITYQRGAHARVDCVQCHIGSGAEWFVKAKINGTHQLISYLTDSYDRPIATPLTGLRPARDTCEKCHWPEKFHGNVEMVYDHYLSDRANTPFTLRMLMHVNTSRPGGHAGGIHWHVNEEEKVEYYAADEKRNEIPWMRVTNLKTGEARVFRTDDFTEEPPLNQIRTMDCMDCHNRPAHDFPTANTAVERAMATGALSLALPNIKREAVRAMTLESITTAAEASEKIAEYLAGRYPDHPDTPGAIEAVQRIFAATIFPERKADWRVYPNHIGHKDWPGCFRCHDDQHKDESGATVGASDCNACHTILSQGSGEELMTLSARGLDFAHPDGELDGELSCVDCHTGGLQ
jgi:nitrate/TMAO reductase-like tetraheme cytochrome c subunit